MHQRAMTNCALLSFQNDDDVLEVEVCCGECQRRHESIRSSGEKTTDQQNPLVDAKETYGEEESLLAIGIHDHECDYGTQQDIRG